MPLQGGRGQSGLQPFRSPLLRLSRLISFPSVTKMFQFTELYLISLFPDVKTLTLRWEIPESKFLLRTFRVFLRPEIGRAHV